MKRLLAAILALVLLASLAGCGIAKRDDSPPPQDIEINDPPQETETTRSSGPVAPGTEQIERTVLFDEDGIRITVNSIDPTEPIFGLAMDFTLENNTDKNLTFVTDTCVINGYSVGSYLYEKVAPHSSIDTTADFDFELAKEESGSECIVDLDLYLYVEDSDTYDILKTIGPVHLETNAKGDYSYSYDDSGAAAVDDANLKITLRELKYDEFDGQYQEFYVENKTSKPISVSLENVTINGKECDPYFYLACAPYSHAFGHISFPESAMKEVSVTDIEELGFSIKVFETETFNTIYESGDLVVTYDE